MSTDPKISGSLSSSGSEPENTSLEFSPDDGVVVSSKFENSGEFVCGWVASSINICITFPINKAIFRQQLHNISSPSAFRQLSKDGLRHLYRGLLPPLMQKSASVSIMFGAYYRCQDSLSIVCPNLNVKFNHTLAALMAGTVEASLCPFERIQTLMQTTAYHDKFKNTQHAFVSLRTYGFREYYRGVSLVLMRNGPSNVFFFLGRETFQEYGPQDLTGSAKMAKDFISGACLGALISTFFFPLNVVKTRIQCNLGGEMTSAMTMWKLVYRERGSKIRYMFKGMHLNYTRSFISWGIINASYEFLMKTFYTDNSDDGKVS